MKPPELTVQQKKEYRRYPFVTNGWDVSLYRSLRGAKHRCNNADYRDYKHYGGKGVEWRLGMPKQAFLEQQEAYYTACRKYPNQTISINRIDSDGHYEEGNIEWIPRSENTKKMHKDNPDVWKKGTEVSKKPVVDCRGNKFDSVSEAGWQTDIAHQSISSCCLGKLQSAGKYPDDTKRRWKFIKIK